MWIIVRAIVATLLYAMALAARPMFGLDPVDESFVLVALASFAGGFLVCGLLARPLRPQNHDEHDETAAPKYR